MQPQKERPVTEKIERRKRQAKFYLSQEAIALLSAESERSTYSMSTLIDMYIKERLGEAQHIPGRALTAPMSTEEVAEALGLNKPQTKPKQETIQEFRGDF